MAGPQRRERPGGCRATRKTALRGQGGHWLDYPIALAVLVIGIGIVMLVALSI